MSALSPSPFLGGRFHLGEKLGGSGGTETWRATEAGSDRICTVLMLETGETSPEAVADRVRVASALQHPSILPTLDVGVTEDGRVYVVREQMPGGNLAAYVRRNGPLPPRKAAAVVRGLVAALDAAHTKGLVHGEVEPAKVSVGADNKPRLTGFGLKGVPPRVERPFAAPEATDPSSVGELSDVYSAGATLFTLVTGKAPVGLAESELGEGALAGIAPALAQVIHRATRRDPRDRYASAFAMLTDLKAIAVVLPPGSGAAKVEPEPARAAPTIAISLDAPLPEVSGRDEETPTQLFDRDVIQMALGDFDRSALGDLRPAIEAMGPVDEPSVATMPAGGADLENLDTAPIEIHEQRKQPPIAAIALVAIGVAACIAIALYLRSEPSSAQPEVAPVPEAEAATTPPPRVEAPPPPVQKAPPPELAPPPVAVEEPPKPAETPHASSSTTKKKPKAAKPVIAPEPIEVEDDGDMNPRITPTVPPAAETAPPADASTTPPAEEQIWDAPPAQPAPAETPPTEAAPAETPPAATAPPAEPAPAEPTPAPAAPAEPTSTEPPATEPAPAN